MNSKTKIYKMQLSNCDLLISHRFRHRHVQCSTHKQRDIYILSNIISYRVKLPIPNYILNMQALQTVQVDVLLSKIATWNDNALCVQLLVLILYQQINNLPLNLHAPFPVEFPQAPQVCGLVENLVDCFEFVCHGFHVLYHPHQSPVAKISVINSHLKHGCISLAIVGLALHIYLILARFSTCTTPTICRALDIFALARTTSRSVFLSFNATRTLTITTVNLQKVI